MNASDGHNDGNHLPSSGGTNKAENVIHHPSTPQQSKPNEGTRAKNHRAPQNQSSKRFGIEEITARSPTSLSTLMATSHTKATPPSAKSCPRLAHSKSFQSTLSLTSTENKINSLGGTYQPREEKEQQPLHSSYDEGSSSSPACPSYSNSKSPSRNHSPQEQLSVLSAIIKGKGKAKANAGGERVGGRGGEEEARRKGNYTKSVCFEQDTHNPPLSHLSKRSSLSPPRRIQTSAGEPLCVSYLSAPTTETHTHDRTRLLGLDEGDDPQSQSFANTAADTPMIEVRVSVPIPPCVSRLPFTLATATSPHSLSGEGEENDDADDDQENVGRRLGRHRPQLSSTSSSTFNIDSTPVRNNRPPPSLVKVQTIDNELMLLCTQQQQNQVSSACYFSSSSSLLVKLKEGDIIVRINGLKPKSLPDAKERLAKLLSSRRTIDLDVLRRPSQLVLKNTSSGGRYGNFHSTSSYEPSSSSSVAGKGKIGIAKMSRNFNIEDSVAVGVLGGIEESSFSEQGDDEANEIGMQDQAEKDHSGFDDDHHLVDNADDGHVSCVSQEYIGVESSRAAAPLSGETTTNLQQHADVSTGHLPISVVLSSSPCPARPVGGQIVFSPSSPHSRMMTAMSIELEGTIEGEGGGVKEHKPSSSWWKAKIDKKGTEKEEHKIAEEDGHLKLVLFEEGEEGKEAVPSSSSTLFVPTFASANRPTEGPTAPFISSSASHRDAESSTLLSVGTLSSHYSDLLIRGSAKVEAKVRENNAAESPSTIEHRSGSDHNENIAGEDEKNTLGIACESPNSTTLCMTREKSPYGSYGERIGGDDNDTRATCGEADTRQAFDNTSVVPFSSDSEFESESETDYSTTSESDASIDSLELDDDNNDNGNDYTVGQLLPPPVDAKKGAFFDSRSRENKREYRLGREIMRLFRKTPHLIDVVLLGGGGGGSGNGHENTGAFLADKYPLLLAATADTIDRRISERFATRNRHANQDLQHNYYHRNDSIAQRQGIGANSHHASGNGGILGGAPLAAHATSSGNTNMYGTPNESEDDEGGLGQQKRGDGRDASFSFNDCGIAKKSAAEGEFSENFHMPSMDHWPYSTSRSLSHLTSLFASFSSRAVSDISSQSAPQQEGPTDMYWPFTPQVGCDDNFHTTMRNLIETENKFLYREQQNLEMTSYHNTKIKSVGTPRERVMTALQKLKEGIERREQVFMANARSAAEKAVGPAPTLASLENPVIASAASGVGAAGAPVPRGRLQKELAAREQMAKQKRLQALLTERENKIKLIVAESLKNRRAMETEQKLKEKKKKGDRQRNRDEEEHYVEESEVRGHNGRVGNVLSYQRKRAQRKLKKSEVSTSSGGISFEKVIGTLFPFFDPPVGPSKKGNDNFGYPVIDGKKVQEELFGTVTTAIATARTSESDDEQHRRDYANEEGEGEREEGSGRKLLISSQYYGSKRPREREGDALSEEKDAYLLEEEEVTDERDDNTCDKSSTLMFTSSNRNQSQTMFLFEKMYEATAAEIRRDRAAAAMHKHHDHHDQGGRKASDHSYREDRNEKVDESVTTTAFSTRDDDRDRQIPSGRHHHQQAEHSETKSMMSTMSVSTFSREISGSDSFNTNNSHNACAFEHLSGKAEVSNPSDYQRREARVGAVPRVHHHQLVDEHVAATSVEDAVTRNPPQSPSSLTTAAPVTANIRIRAPREELLRHHREAVALAKQLALEGVIGGQGQKGKGGMESGSSEHEKYKNGNDRVERKEDEEDHNGGRTVTTANRNEEGKGNNNETVPPNNNEDDKEVAPPPLPPQNKRRRLVFMGAFKQHDHDTPRSAYPPYPSSSTTTAATSIPPPPPPSYHNSSTHSSMSTSHSTMMRTEQKAAGVAGEETTAAPPLLPAVMPTMSQEERDTIRRRHREMLQQQREEVERLKRERRGDKEEAADSGTMTSIRQNAALSQQSPVSLAPPPQNQQQMYPALRSPTDDLIKRSPREKQQASLSSPPLPQAHSDPAAGFPPSHVAEPQLLAQLHAQNQHTLQQMQMAVSAEVQRRGMQQHYQMQNQQLHIHNGDRNVGGGVGPANHLEQQQRQQRLYSHSQQYDSSTYQQHYLSTQHQQIQQQQHVYHTGGFGVATPPPSPMYSVDPFLGPTMSGGANTTTYLASPTTPGSFHQQSIIMQTGNANLGSPPMISGNMSAVAAAVTSSPITPIAPLMGMVYHTPSTPSASTAAAAFSAHSSAANFPAQPPHYQFYQQ